MEWTDWKTRRVAFKRERESTRAHMWRLLSTWRHEDSLSFLLEVGSLEAEPKVPELKI